MNLTNPNPPSKVYTDCPICGIEGLYHWHHVFGGSNKKKSEKYGAIIYPCPTCHIWGTNSIHKQQSQQLNKELKQLFQQQIMEQYKLTTEDWISIFGRNYL